MLIEPRPRGAGPGMRCPQSVRYVSFSSYFVCMPRRAAIDIANVCRCLLISMLVKRANELSSY